MINAVEGLEARIRININYQHHCVMQLYLISNRKRTLNYSSFMLLIIPESMCIHPGRYCLYSVIPLGCLPPSGTLT